MHTHRESFETHIILIYSTTITKGQQASLILSMCNSVFISLLSWTVCIIAFIVSELFYGSPLFPFVTPFKEVLYCCHNGDAGIR